MSGLVADGARQAIETINFNGGSIRMLTGGNETVFVARDLVEAVGATWCSTAIAHIPDDFKGVRSTLTPGGTQSVTCLTEAGMNMYLFRSDKLAALPWQRHLAEVVLPSIRKTGQYQSTPMTLAQQCLAQAQSLVAIEQAQQEHERRLALHSAELASIQANQEAEKLERDRALEAVGALPPAPVEASERSYGQMTVALVNSWASANSRDFRGTWNKFYQAVEERPETRIDLKTRLANAKAKKQNVRASDLIDLSGKSPEIYAIARQLFARAS